MILFKTLIWFGYLFVLVSVYFEGAKPGPIHKENFTQDEVIKAYFFLYLREQWDTHQCFCCKYFAEFAIIKQELNNLNNLF